MARSEIIEGIFAINKPQSLSSAEVLRRLQDHFIPSRIFAPLMQRDADSRPSRPRYKKHWKDNRATRVKLGHGGTLDPLATGVLICGVGRGTKMLPRFLECTKTYETVVLFGAATDSYDIVGKRLALAPYTHITQAKVEEALGQFRGKIMQRPPIFSALRMDGKRLYEYAREGLPLPKEIAKRPVEVLNLELVEWMEGGSHDFKWPEELAGTPERVMAEKLMDNIGHDQVKAAEEANQHSSSKGDGDGTRKHDIDNDTSKDDGDAELSPPLKKAKISTDDISATDPVMSGALPPGEPTDSVTNNDTSSPSPPAARIRMTVTSGFYVRSLCNDLGPAVGSLGLMASLVRTQQGGFSLGQNVLEYEDLAKGEDAWGPKVQEIMEEYSSNNPEASEDEKPSNKRSRPGRQDRGRGGRGGGRAEKHDAHGRAPDNGEHVPDGRKRRNSSSVEP